MTSVLFLGNSHLSALKLAWDDLREELPIAARFFCARGADLFFTRLSVPNIVPSPRGAISKAQLQIFYGVLEGVPDNYARPNNPMSDVATQLLATGGAPEIDLSGVRAIFYVAGMSPYDFVRLGRTGIAMSHAQRRAWLASILGADFLLQRLVEDVKSWFPNCRHYLIGRPLGFFAEVPLDGFPLKDVVASREAIRAMVRDFLFDDVFMPPAEVLSESLLATKRAFFVEGRQESEMFQRTQPTVEDDTHVNRHYGTVVLRAFVEPILKRL